MGIRDLAQGLPRVFMADVLAFAPGLAVATYFFGVEGALAAALTSLPLAALSARRAIRMTGSTPANLGMHGGSRAMVVAALDAAIRSGETQRSTAFVVCLDTPDRLLSLYGKTGFGRINSIVEDRLADVIRDGDVQRTLDNGRFAIAIISRSRLDLESAIQIAGRMQKSLGEPVSVDGATVHFTVSIGFCQLSRAPETSGAAALASAELALNEAWMNGPGAIRAYSSDTHPRASREAGLRDQIESALDNGEIVAFFQPQISTDTGAVSGFEALVRWMHPTRGILPPSEFMPAVKAAGLSARLSETMLIQALSALRTWDREGYHVDTVSVNFASEDLRDTSLVARLKWELDRFDLPAQRLTVEVLESVVAESDHDVIVRNLTALSQLGCGIDLDDFGTGHASIAAIRRFSVNRIKIDRSFISGVDSDPDQQRIVTAILCMAEQLGLETVAEGVETLSEHALLSQLGCAHVQGFSISRPMPVQSTRDWLARHQAKLDRTPGLNDRKAM